MNFMQNVTMSINQGLAKTENTLNTLDLIPVVSTFSGIFRISMIAIGEIFLAFAHTIASFIHILTQEERGFCRYWQAIKTGISYIMHAMGNVCRGVIACIPILHMPIVYFYDNYVGRMNYAYEILPENTYPLMGFYGKKQLGLV